MVCVCVCVGVCVSVSETYTHTLVKFSSHFVVTVVTYTDTLNSRP